MQVLSVAAVRLLRPLHLPPPPIKHLSQQLRCLLACLFFWLLASHSAISAAVAVCLGSMDTLAFSSFFFLVV